jgi:hypothetical protein
MQGLYIFVVLLVTFFILVFDYWAAKGLRDLNKRISQDPNFLADPSNKSAAEATLNTLAYMGPFRFIEAQKLKKSLNK